MSPVVSVIIPVYNQESCLGTCLDSILEQDFADFEIILVDDASSDFTFQVCELYAKKDERIKLFINEKNRGQGYSRNIAFEKARGKYITFVDSDDYIQSPLLTEGVQILEEHVKDDVDIVIFNRESKNIYNSSVDWQKFSYAKRTGKEVFEDFCLGHLNSYGVVSKVYRKKYLDKHSITFPEYMWEDNLFSLKSYYYAQNIVFTGTHGYTRMHAPHEASAMNPLRITPRHISGICALVADIHAFFTQLNPKDAEQFLEHAKTFEQHFLTRFKSFFSYMAKCYDKGINPLREKDLENIHKSSYFLHAILDDCIYIQEKSAKNKINLSNDIFSQCLYNKDFFETILREYILCIESNNKQTEIIEDNIYIQKIKHIQNELQSLASPNLLSNIFGELLLKNIKSIKSCMKLPYILYKNWLFFSKRTPPNSLGGKNFSVLLDIYHEKGIEAAEEILRAEYISPQIIASAYTILARHVMNYDNLKSAELSRLAYIIDPKHFRLKWMAFRYYKCGKLLDALAMIDMLPKNTYFSDSEVRYIIDMRTQLSVYQIEDFLSKKKSLIFILFI